MDESDIKEDEKIEQKSLELRDAFGNPYTVYGIPREKIEQILTDLNIDEIVEKAYRSYCPGLANGVAQLNIEDGKLIGATYTTGSGDIQGMHYIDLYGIEQNLDLLTEDILAPEEIQEYQEELGSIEEFCEEKGIDYEEREIEALVQYAYEYIKTDDWWSDIVEQLNGIYGESKDEQ